MPEEFFVVNIEDHERLVSAAYKNRGYTTEEAAAAARCASHASRHGIRTHNALKALHLDDLLGSRVGGSVPGATIDKLSSRFSAAQVWNANRKIGQFVAEKAFDTCIDLANTNGVGIVSVDNAFHYLWGGGFVMEAAKRGYIAYTNCTASLAEVVPYQGKYPTLGTNPHSWAFPTQEVIGYPIVIDWATSVIAMGKVQQLAREDQNLPVGAAVDVNGNPTTDAKKASALLPFGGHKGYGLSLINEIVAAFIGGSLPSLRCREPMPGEKNCSSFFFQIIHPEALSSGTFARGRKQSDNVQAVLEDILGHGNEHCLLPGQLEAQAAQRNDQAGGLSFSLAELQEFDRLAKECSVPCLSRKSK